jgi:hypothetical protein
MTNSAAACVSGPLDQLISFIGKPEWQTRLAAIRRGCTPGHAGRALARLHTIELTVDRLWRTRGTPASPAEIELASLAAALAALSQSLSAQGAARLRAQFAEALTGARTILPLFHLVRCADLQRSRGFDVHFAGLEDNATFDILLHRDGAEAEMLCEVVSAEDGRDLHRGAWSHLVDRVDPDLQSWLATHPGRYLLKMTLPRGLKSDPTADTASEAPIDADGSANAPTSTAALAVLHARITRLLTDRRRADHDEAAVLRLEPLLLAGAQASELGLMRGLRQEFGHEAHLAVTAAGSGVFVMAARAAREDEVAEAVQRRMAQIAPARLTGTRPGILAMFIEDTDRLEWRILRDQLRLEGAARQFLTQPEAKAVIAVTCTSRQELFRVEPPDAAVDGEVRFRNPSHPMARTPQLAAAVLSLT